MTTAIKDVPKVNPLSYRDIEYETIGFLKTHYPKVLVIPQPTPILEIFDVVLPDEYDVMAGVVEALPAPLEGVTYRQGDQVFIDIPESTYTSASNGDGRSRFTLAHEIGHAVLHSDQIHEAMVSGNFSGLYRTEQISSERNPEIQANRFAATILMPESTMLVALKRYGCNMTALQRLFKVSYSALKFRLQNMKYRAAFAPYRAEIQSLE